MRRIALAAVSSLIAALLMTGAAQAAPGNGAASGWHISYFQNTAPSPSSPSAPSAPGGIASLNFTSAPNTSLLVTSQKAQFGGLLGNLAGKTVTATFTISGATAPFTYYGEGAPSNPCGTPANTRLYFDTSNAGGFDETHYWWSNPASAVLANGTYTVTAKVDGSQWTDFFGHSGSDPAYSSGFAAAASNVTDIGLSFGGGCFFENGVGTADGSGSLTLSSYSAN